MLDSNSRLTCFILIPIMCQEQAMKSVDCWVVDRGSSQHIMSKRCNLVKGGNVIGVCDFGNVTGMDGFTKNMNFS